MESIAFRTVRVRPFELGYCYSTKREEAEVIIEQPTPNAETTVISLKLRVKLIICLSSRVLSPSNFRASCAPRQVTPN
jgi:hypothetical protein